MSEINNTPSNTTLNAVTLEALEQQKKRADTLELALTEAEAKVKEFEEALACSKNREEFLGASVVKWSNSWEKVKDRLTEFYEDGTLTEGVPLDDYLIEEFEIEIDEEVEITYRASWSRTITIKKGYDLDDLELDRELPDDLKLTINGEAHYLGRDSAEFEY